MYSYTLIIHYTVWEVYHTHNYGNTRTNLQADIITRQALLILAFYREGNCDLWAGPRALGSMADIARGQLLRLSHVTATETTYSPPSVFSLRWMVIVEDCTSVFYSTDLQYLF